jgi:hypothetical protein
VLSLGRGGELEAGNAVHLIRECSALAEGPVGNSTRSCEEFAELSTWSRTAVALVFQVLNVSSAILVEGHFLIGSESRPVLGDTLRALVHCPSVQSRKRCYT